MALFTLKPLQQHHHSQFLPCSLCKLSSFTPHSFKFNYSCVNLSFIPTKHTLPPKISPFLDVRAHVTHLKETNLPDDAQQEHSHKFNNGGVFGSGVASFRDRDKGVEKAVKNEFTSQVREQKGGFRMKDRYVRNKVLGSERKKDMGHGLKSNASKIRGKKVKGEDVGNVCKKGEGDKVGVAEKRGRRAKKKEVDPQEVRLKIALDMCSKRGDVIGAIQLFDLAQRDGIKLGQYHYAVILYLCSSATTGIVQVAKSGKGSRSLSSVDVPIASPGEFSEVSDNSHGAITKGGLVSVFNGKGKSNGSVHLRPQTLDELIHLIKNDVSFSNVKYVSSGQKDYEFQVSEDVQGYARERGFEIYNKMLSEKVPVNEATLTSVARMAMSMDNGEMAFDIIKQMKALGINPKLRSYGPALFVFTKNGDIENAFLVEKHMLEHGVYPEEPELEALLRVSIEAGSADKVYYLLHKLRTTVRKVSPNTACLIEKWFCSKVASKVGKRNWDQKLVKEAIANGGGGWHGQGWLGNGKWMVSRTSIGADGLCKCCGEKLVTIDLDPTETEKFAESVASLAREREKNTNFERFQKWLDYYGPFEAVVDGANVGYYSQRKFKPTKVNALVNGIRQMLTSKHRPLIVLHNRRITGDKMDEPVNKGLIVKWKNADAIYLTPTGSNDDWYWLYAAIKCKSLLVTNDEMRDHLFQLLGNDFFPKWKERHQVRFTFSGIGPVFHMPPPCSVVIQESANGHWHVPLVSENDSEIERTWLCVTRVKSQTKQNLATKQQDSPRSHRRREDAKSDSLTKAQVNLPPLKHGNYQSGKPPPEEFLDNILEILSPSALNNNATILQQIDAAEKLGGCTLDFDI